ncbi:MAG: hypothetical protein LBK72_09960 [Bifidobacteriaceae bacterium]|nr:hypothetical protein [Bifidobacteriaceae bacterium]
MSTRVLYCTPEPDVYVDGRGTHATLAAASRRPDGTPWPVALLLDVLTVFADDIEEACAAADPTYHRLSREDRDAVLLDYLVGGRVALSDDVAARMTPATLPEPF